jgi:signal transduction histidine kinase
MTADRLSGDAGTTLTVSVGVVLFAFHVRQVVVYEQTLGTFVSGIMVPMTLSLLVVGAGVWIRQTPLRRRYTLRVAAWCLIGALLLVVGSGLTVFYQAANGVRMVDRVFVLVGSASFGAPLGLIVGLYDGRRQMASDDAERSSAQLTVLNRVLRHDVRNKATVIRGRAELFDETDDHDHLRVLHRKTGELVEISELAREAECVLQADESQREVIDLVDVVRAGTESIRTEYDVDLRVPDAEACPVIAHPLVESAVAELLDNAVVHNDIESPSVEVSLGSPDPDRVELSVADNGPGIPDEQVETLERGFETDLEHTSGLGLWLVHWVVNASGGRVRFRENDPRGSVVCIELESASAADADAPATPAAPES